MSLQARDYQREAIVDTRRRWDAGAIRVPVVMATGLGKGHPLDTDVPTPDGWRKWGDLAIGDRVFGRSGDPVRVTNVFDRGELPAYRVTFSDESSIIVDGDHLWTVRDSGQSYRPWVTVTTAEIARHELKRTRGWRFHIPMAGQARYDAPRLPVDPYVIGALLSNGSMTGTSTQLTTPDAHVAQRCAQATPVKRIDDRTPGVCPRYILSGMTEVTRELGMRVHSKVKRIPEMYRTAEVHERIALLHGLMDGDGAKRDTSRRSVAYFTSSLSLAGDVSELVASLGGTGIVKTYDRGAKGVEYAVRILLPSSIPAFSEGRKSDNGVDSVRNLQPKRAIVSIKPVGNREIRCITVDAPDRLYLIGHQYIVTHNTVFFTTLIEEWLADPANAGKRALVIAHTNELIDQAAQKMRAVAPHRRVGIVKGALNNVTAEVIVSSRQTLASEKRRSQIKRVGLIVIDECHHAVATNTCGKILDHFDAFGYCLACKGDGCEACNMIGQWATDVKVLGVTATLARSDKAKLSSVWEECTFKRDIMFGIRRGYLLDVRGERVVVDDLNMKNVKTVGGDYSESSMADELERTFAVEKVAEQYLKIAGERKGVAFWPLVATAEHAADVFTAAGIPSAAVSGQTDKRVRKMLLNDLRAGRIQVVHNAMVLTEGWDEPSIEVAVIGRPTKSAPLYQQMAGRALRPDLTLAPEDRRPALIIDVTGASDGQDLRSLIDLSPERPLNNAYDEHPDATLSELEEFYSEIIEEEIGEQRAGASFTFESEEYSGATTTRSFDPLGRKSVWGKTPSGTYYSPAGKSAYVFVVESVAADSEPGTYDVVICSTNETYNARYDESPPWQRGTEHVGLHLDMALSWAEDVAEQFAGGMALAARNSAWRRRAPGEGMKKLARFKYGIDGEMFATAGELSEAISAAQAQRRIDPLVALVKSRMQ